MKHVIIVGDKPSPKMKPGAPAFQGAACEKRVHEWLQKICKSDYSYTLFNSTDEKAPTWCKWAVEDDHPIIALGNNASKFLSTLPHFKLPHPSGQNRQINDQEFIDSKLEECYEYMRNFNVSHSIQKS